MNSVLSIKDSSAEKCVKMARFRSKAQNVWRFHARVWPRTHCDVLMKVMMMGSTAVAQVLLRHGADPNVADSSTGATPLHDAARTGFLDTVQLLVEAGADPQAEDREGRSPGDVARQNGHADVAAFLSPGLLNRPEAAHKLN